MSKSVKDLYKNSKNKYLLRKLAKHTEEHHIANLKDRTGKYDPSKWLVPVMILVMLAGVLLF